MFCINPLFQIITSVQGNFVDRATGASPPWSATRDIACSPISFKSSIRSISNEAAGHSTSLVAYEKENSMKNK